MVNLNHIFLKEIGVRDHLMVYVEPRLRWLTRRTKLKLLFQQLLELNLATILISKLLTLELTLLMIKK